MKKLLSIFACAVLVFCLAMPAFAFEAETKVVEPNAIITWYINADGVHLRESEGGTSLGLVYSGDTFKNGGISDNEANGIQWRHCSMTSGQNSGRTGYVAKQYTSWKLF